MMYMDEKLYTVCVEEVGHHIDARNGELIDQRLYKCYARPYQVIEVCGGTYEGHDSGITLLASPVAANGKDLAIIVNDAGEFHTSDYIYDEHRRCFPSLKQAKIEVERIVELIKENTKNAVIIA